MFPSLGRDRLPLSDDYPSTNTYWTGQLQSSSSTYSPDVADTVFRPSVASLAGYPSLWEAAGSQPFNTVQAAMDVWLKFNTHLDRLLDSVRDLRFDAFEPELRSFWLGLTTAEKETCQGSFLSGLIVRGQTVAMKVSQGRGLAI